MINLILVFKYQTAVKSDVVDAVETLSHITDIKLKGFARYAKRIKSTSESHFDIANKDLSFSFYSMGNCKMDVIRINLKCDKLQILNELVECFINVGDFLQAWAVENEYAHWQKAHDPIQYEVKGRSYEGLPMKSNGLPHPLKKMIIDTGDNPGRETLKIGHIEAVGGVTWVSDKLFEITNADKKELINSSLFEIIKQDDIVRIKIDDLFLQNAAGDSKLTTKQNNLRSILYPK